MNPRKGFVLHPEAAAGIAGFWTFIARDNPLRRPDLTSGEFRFNTSGEYLIAYAPDEDPLLLISVIHGRRSPRTIAAMLRERDW